jgi:hypothetical protein
MARWARAPVTSARTRSCARVTVTLASAALALAGACAGEAGGDGARDRPRGVPSGAAGAAAGASGQGGAQAAGSSGAGFGDGAGIGASAGASGSAGCGGDGECPQGQICNPDSGQCEIGGDCGQTQFELTELPPNMMILLDRSASMDGDAEDDTRWNVAKSAIEAVTVAFDDAIRFGLATYSACVSGGCTAGTIVIPIAANNATAINGFLATTLDERSSDGQETSDDGKVRYLCDTGDPETTTGMSLAALVGEPSLLDTTRTNAVVLLTDGEESEECAEDCDGPCGAERLLSQSPAVKTYAIGLGVNPEAIDAIAAAGETGQAIGASNLAELSSAFDRIAAAVASCDYTLDDAPPNTAELYVFFNDDPAAVASDAGDGWSYEPTTRRLRFHGSACEQVKAGAVSDIDVVYGCPRPVVD